MQATLQAIEDYYARYMNMQLGISIMGSVGSATKSLRLQWHYKMVFFVYYGLSALVTTTLISKSGIINYKHASSIITIAAFTSWSGTF